MSIPAIEDLLRVQVGLDAKSIGRTSLVRSVEQRQAALGLDQAEAYLQALRDSREELQELIELVVVPETWFFRHPEAYFELASTWVRWVMRQRGVFRVLSVPCSTGEEPYSAAMILLDRGAPKDRFVVDAVDISRRSLALAERGVFGRNSFRADSGPLSAHVAHVRAGCRVSEPVRHQVRFAYGNLLADEFLAASQPYDVIFCRNLLIYFDNLAQQKALGTLERLLSPEGVLIVGPADGFAALTYGFAPTGRPGAFAYRKAQPSHQRRPAGPIGRGLPPQRRAQHAVAVRPRAAGRAGGAASEPRQEREGPPPVPTLAEARALADAGRIAEADEACRRHLEGRSPSADALCLLALVRDALNDRSQAIECYRKALYLDPGHLEALAHLALLVAQRGEGEQAGVLAARARRAARIDSGQG